jgi:hypothetical protein
VFLDVGANVLLQALARAVYARRKIVILDDVLGGLDNTTEHHVFHSLLGTNGLLREMNATVLIVSSSGTFRHKSLMPTSMLSNRIVKRVPFSDHTVCLSPNGEITSQGTFTDLNNAGGYVSSFSLPRPDWSYTPENNDQIVQAELAKEQEGSTISQSKDEEDSGASLTSSETVCPRDGEDGMSRRTGDVQIYLYYVKSVGWWASLIFVIGVIGFVFCISFPSRSIYFEPLE